MKYIYYQQSQVIATGLPKVGSLGGSGATGSGPVKAEETKPEVK